MIPYGGLSGYFPESNGNLNHISIHRISDACQFRVVRYSLWALGWRFVIPKVSPIHGDLWFKNLWEFLRMVVAVLAQDHDSQ
jgi:hypothetical protein